jgi:putative MFS transporter
MFDAMDVGLVGFVLVGIGRDWGLERTQLGLIASAGFLGMFLGALVAGRLADRYGRRPLFMATLLTYSIATLLSGLAWNLPSLLAFRFLVGLGLGGELPVASTLVSEFAPAGSRGRMLVILESFWAYGWILAAVIGLVVVPALPEWGWRVAFFIGALPALYALYLRRRLPESPRYLELAGRHEEAVAVVRRLETAAGAGSVPLEPEIARPSRREAILPRLLALWRRDLARRTLMLWVLWFGIVFSYYGVFTWLPQLLVDRGLAIARSFSYVFITTLAQIPGYFSAAYLVDRWGRRPTLVTYLLGSAIAAWLLGSAGSDPILVLWGCLLSFFNLGAWGGRLYLHAGAVSDPDPWLRGRRGSGLRPVGRDHRALSHPLAAHQRRALSAGRVRAVHGGLRAHRGECARPGRGDPRPAAGADRRFRRRGRLTGSSA